MFSVMALESVRNIKNVLRIFVGAHKTGSGCTFHHLKGKFHHELIIKFISQIVVKSAFLSASGSQTFFSPSP